MGLPGKFEESQMKMQAKDISDKDFLAAVLAESLLKGAMDEWTMYWDVVNRLDVNWKVAMAKFRKLEKRKLVDGCACGCRGDWVLTQSGIDLLGETK